MTENINIVQASPSQVLLIRNFCELREPANPRTGSQNRNRSMATMTQGRSPSFQDIQQVSLAGGAQPRWRGDGKELFFIDPQGKMMSATVEREPPLKTGTPRNLFDTGVRPEPNINQYAVTEDGLKFLVVEPRKGFLETYSVVLNWPAIVN